MVRRWVGTAARMLPAVGRGTGSPEDADTFARDRAAAEEDPERTFGARWARLWPQLLAELASWWHIRRPPGPIRSGSSIEPTAVVA